MPDFDWVTARVATGAAITSAADVDALVTAGVTHVLDARAEMDDAPLLSTHPALLYCWNPTDDDGKSKPADYWAKTLLFALPALAAPHNRVYFHCAAGINRGPSNAYAALRAQGLSPITAMGLIKTARPQAQARYSGDVDIAIPILGYA